MNIAESRISLIGRVSVGTTFYETVHDQHQLQTVTRVTDREFDTMNQATREVIVRSLKIWDSVRFTNNISRLRFGALVKIA